MSIQNDVKAYKSLLKSLAVIDNFSGAINDPSRNETVLINAGAKLISGDITLEQYLDDNTANWQEFSSAVSKAMEGWIPKKYGHSIAVAEGVDALTQKISREHLDQEDPTNNALRDVANNAAFIHDCGTVVNVLGSDMHLPLRYVLHGNEAKQKKFAALDGVTPRDFCRGAAAKLLAGDGMSAEDKAAIGAFAKEIGADAETALAGIIAADAISDRGGAIYKLAKTADPDIHGVLRAFYKEPTVHRANIPGPHTLDEHHNKPKIWDGPKQGDEAFWNKSHSFYDHAGITVDSIFGGLPDAKSLDELAIYALAAAETGKMDKAYVRAFMESYGSGGSTFEKAYAQIKDFGVKEIPGVARMPAPAAEFAEDVLSIEAIKQKYSQLEWSALGEDNEAGEKLRREFSAGIKSAGSVFGFVVQKVASYPELAGQRLAHDIENINLGEVHRLPQSDAPSRRVAQSGPEFSM